MRTLTHKYTLGEGITKQTVLRISQAAVLVVATVALLLSSLASPTPARADQSLEQWQIDGFAQLDTGGSYSCGVTNITNQIWCWGDNTYGQLGDGTKLSSAVPVRVNASGVLAGKAISSISAGYTATCAVADGKAYCWGMNYFGQLGNNSQIDSAVPVAVDTTGALAGKTVTKIDSGYDTTCAIADGKAYCWGNGGSGRIGNGTSTSSPVPVAVDTTGALAGKTVTSISSDTEVTCAVASGKAYCWGRGEWLGYLDEEGEGLPSSGSASPLAVYDSGALASKTVTSITTGSAFVCAIADGKAYCWGQNYYGNFYGILGSNSGNTIETIPVAVDTTGALAGKTVTSISANTQWGTCVTADGKAYCWGYGDAARNGNGANVSSGVPVPVDTTGALAGKTVIATSSGGLGGCALTTDSQIYCWGYNNTGQLGNNKMASGSTGSLPVALSPTSMNIVTEEYRILVDETEDKQITINGASFKQGAVVLFGPTQVTPTQVTWNSIKVNVPVSVTEKTVDITVKNVDDTSATLLGGLVYYYMPPAITNITPTVLYTGVSGRPLRIVATYLEPGAKVFFDNVEVPVTPDSVSWNAVTVTYPLSATEKTVTLKVQNPTGASTTQQISYVNVDITGIVINEAIDSGHPNTKIIEVSGHNFKADYLFALTGSLVTLNGSPIGFCTTADFNATLLQQAQIAPEYYSNNPPCYRVFSDGAGAGASNIQITPTLYKVRVASSFNTSDFTVQIDGMSAPYHHPSGNTGNPVGTNYITNPPAGFVITNAANTDLSQSGTTAAHTTVILRTSSGMMVAEIPVDTSATRDWSNVTAGIDVETGMAFVHGLVAAPGADSPTFTLYVPKKASDNAVVICPGASSLTDLGLHCPNARTYSIDDPSVSVVWGSDFQQYWKITGLTGTGGVSLALSASQYFAITGRQLPTGVPGAPNTGYALIEKIANGQKADLSGTTSQSGRLFYLGVAFIVSGITIGVVGMRRRNHPINK